VAVKKVIWVVSQARGLASDWPIDGKPGLRCGVLREPSRLPCWSVRRHPTYKRAGFAWMEKTSPFWVALSSFSVALFRAPEPVIL